VLAYTVATGPSLSWCGALAGDLVKHGSAVFLEPPIYASQLPEHSLTTEVTLD